VWRSEGKWSEFCDTTNGGPPENDELKNSTDLIIYMTEEMRSELRKKKGGGPETVLTVEEEYPLMGDLAKAVREKLGIHEAGVEGERKLNCRIVEPKGADVDVAIEVVTADALSRARQQELAGQLKKLWIIMK